MQFSVPMHYCYHVERWTNRLDLNRLGQQCASKVRFMLFSGFSRSGLWRSLAVLFQMKLNWKKSSRKMAGALYQPMVTQSIRPKQNQPEERKSNKTPKSTNKPTNQTNKRTKALQNCIANYFPHRWCIPTGLSLCANTGTAMFFSSSSKVQSLHRSLKVLSTSLHIYMGYILIHALNIAQAFFFHHACCHN